MPYSCDPCVCPEQHYRDSESWRKAMITLLCDIETAISSFIVNENLWDRVGTNLVPHYVGDTVSLSYLTPGSILFAGAAGLISQDNANWFYDAVNHRVGIGTTGPLSKLDVAGGNNSIGTGGLSDLAFELGVGGVGGYRHFITSKHDSVVGNGNAIEFLINNSATAGGSSAPGTGNVNVMGIYGSGNVGIGTTDPQAQLHIFGTYVGHFLIEEGGTGGHALAKFKNNAGTTIIGQAGNPGTDLATGGINYSAMLVAPAAQAVQLAPGGAVAMTLLSTGNVGIGTTTPGGTAANGFTLTSNARTLELNSATVTGYPSLYLRNSSASVGLDITADPATTGAVFFDSRYSAGGAGTLAFQFRTATAGTAVNAISILGNGNVGIGTVTSQAKLEVEDATTLGSELVTNGGFATNTAGWTDLAGTTIASVAGGQSGNALQITNGVALYGYCQQIVTTIPNTRYILTWYQKNGSHGGYTKVGTSQGQDQLVPAQTYSNANWTAYSLEFIATTTTTYLTLGIFDNTVGSTTLYDTISLKEVTGGNIIARGKFTGGGTSGIKVDGNGNVILNSNTYLWSTTLNLENNIIKIVSNSIRHTHAAEITSSSATYTKVKTITFTSGLRGAQRFIFDMKTSNVLGTAYAKIYKNGVALGTEQTDVTGVYATKTQDITQDWNPGDTCELWIHEDGTYSCYVQNFTVRYTDSEAVDSVNS